MIRCYNIDSITEDDVDRIEEALNLDEFARAVVYHRLSREQIIELLGEALENLGWNSTLSFSDKVLARVDELMEDAIDDEAEARKEGMVAESGQEYEYEYGRAPTDKYRELAGELVDELGRAPTLKEVEERRRVKEEADSGHMKPAEEAGIIRRISGSVVKFIKEKVVPYAVEKVKELVRKKPPEVEEYEQLKTSEEKQKEEYAEYPTEVNESETAEE
jgi:hypothetical protein